MNMESSVQPQTQETESAYRSFIALMRDGDHLPTLRQQMEQLNTIGKRFVAAIDRFQVHRALLATLQELYSFSACSILLKGNPIELSIIPRYPLTGPFFEAMTQSIARAARAIDFPDVTAQELAVIADLDAPDDLAPSYTGTPSGATGIGDFLNIPLTVENRIIGILSLFDEHEGTFDTELLQLTTMIADYAAVALENVRLRERQMALWRDAEHERQRLELIISSMAEGLLITNAQGAITSLNSSARQLLAQVEVDLEQKTPTPLRHLAASTNVSWLSDLADIVDQALAGNIVMNRELLAGDIGETVPLTLSISAAPLHDTSQTLMRPIGVVAVLNDVTSNKQIEKLKDEFVSIVSHELRSPLTAIKGYTQHLVRRIERRLRKAQSSQDSQPTPSASAIESPESVDLRSLHIVQSQTDHLERLVNELLDLSHVQEGQLTLKYSTFSLADVLADCVNSVQVSAEQHALSFLCLIEDTKDTTITADHDRIAQVIGNLLDNAIKYSPQGGQIVVSLEMKQGNYYIQIIDQGIGVSTEHYDHIFERFYRIRSATSHYSGIGLGLYVAKAIIERHGGEIGFFNNANIGTTFYFTLPLRPRTQPLS